MPETWRDVLRPIPQSHAEVERLMSIPAPHHDDGPSQSGIKIVHRSCPQCDTDNCDQPPNPYSLSPWVIRDCVCCGFVYIDSAPEYRHLAVEMAWETTFAENEIR